MERINKLYVLMGLVIALGLFLGIAHADEANDATTITFSAPVEIPGHVLPAGTYLFKLDDTNDGQGVVQIFNSEETHLYASVLTVSTQRATPTNGTVITLAEQAGAPDALIKWFYPGSLTGKQFMYSSHEEQQLARDTQQTIAASPVADNTDIEAGD